MELGFGLEKIVLYDQRLGMYSEMLPFALDRIRRKQVDQSDQWMAWIFPLVVNLPPLFTSRECPRSCHRSLKILIVVTLRLTSILSQQSLLSP